MRLRDLLNDFKRRHVFRVACGYCAIGFLIVEVANNFFPALRLPAWTTTLTAALVVLGFPIAVVLAWAYEITPEGVRRTPPTEPAAAEPAAAERRWTRWLAPAAAVVILLAGGRVIMERRAGASGAASLTSIAVLPFSARTSAEFAYLGDGMVELLSRDLDGAGKLRTLDPAAVLKRGRAVAAEGFDPVRAAAAARELGAGLFIAGTIHEAFGRLRIQAALYDAFHPERPLRESSADGVASDVFDLVDRLAVDLFADRRFGATSAELVRAAAVTTRSTAALRAYLEGESAFRVADMETAISAFQRAIAEDSTFGLAYYRLGSTYWWAEPRPGLDRLELYRRSREAAERAAALRDRLGERDRRLVDAFVALHRGTPDQAEELYRGLLRDYPADVEAAFQLADLLHHWNAVRGRPVAEARPLFEQVLAADPEFACPI